MIIKPGRFRLVYLSGLVSLFGLLTWIYLPALDNGFQFDDYPNIVEAYPLHLSELGFNEIKGALTGAVLQGRNLANLTFIIDWWRGGGNPYQFQQTNIILHLLNVGICLLLFVSLLRRIYPKISANWIILAAGMAALVWGLHPIQIQAVTYIVQRMAEMAVLFVLLSCYGYLRGRLTSGWPRLLWFTMACITAIAGVFSKENAVILPGLWWLLEFGVVRHGQPLMQYRFDRWLLVLPWLLLVLIVGDLLLSGSITSPYVAGYATRDFTLEERLLTQPRVIFFHISQIFWPMPDRFSIFHDPELSSSLYTPVSTLISLFCLIGWVGIGFWTLLRKNSRIVGALMLWIPATLVIESSFIPLEMVFEHRMYMPTVGLAGLLAVLLLSGTNRSPWWFWARWCVVVIIVVPLLSWSSAKRLPDWKDQLTLYNSAIKIAPENVRANFNLANLLQKHGQHNDAIKYYNKVLELDLENGDAYNNMARSYRALEHFEDARHFLLQALKIAPTNYNSLGSLALLELRDDKWQEAETLLLRAIKIDPHKETAYIYLNQLYSEQGNWNAALQLLEEGIKASQGNPVLYNELGVLLAKQRKLEQAKVQFQRAISIYPRYGIAYGNLGGVLVELGEFEAGQSILKQALVLEPGLVLAQQNLRAVEQYLQNRGNN